MSSGRNGGAIVSVYAVYPCRLKGFEIQTAVKARGKTKVVEQRKVLVITYGRN